MGGGDPVADATVYEERLPFGAGAIKTTPDGWPWFRIALPAGSGSGRDGDAVLVFGLRAAPGGFAFFLRPLAEDGTLIAGREAVAPAGDDWWAAWRAFVALRHGEADLGAWLRERPAFADLARLCAAYAQL
jgi:hypothetical protein